MYYFTVNFPANYEFSIWISDFGKPISLVYTILTSNCFQYFYKKHFKGSYVRKFSSDL